MLLNEKHHFPHLADIVWLNAAHQGPLPASAVNVAIAQAKAKATPVGYDEKAFRELPASLRREIAQLLGAKASEIILANSASYTPHMIVNAYPWTEGDVVLLQRGDFPTNHLPWKLAEKRGAVIRYVGQGDHSLSAEEIDAAICDRTRIFCTSWVMSLTGICQDMSSIGEICRSNNVRTVINGSQAVGAMEINPRHVSIDCLFGCGFKWLLGPYGSGYAWLDPLVWADLHPQNHYWLDAFGLADLERENPLDANLPQNFQVERHDIFGTANFFVFAPWLDCLRLINSIGMTTIENHNRSISEMIQQTLVDQKIGRCNNASWSPIFYADIKGHEVLELAESLRRMDVHFSVRRGKIRFSPHFYNNSEDIEQLGMAISQALS